MRFQFQFTAAPRSRSRRRRSRSRSRSKSRISSSSSWLAFAFASISEVMLLMMCLVHHRPSVTIATTTTTSTSSSSNFNSFVTKNSNGGGRRENHHHNIHHDDLPSFALSPTALLHAAHSPHQHDRRHDAVAGSSSSSSSSFLIQREYQYQYDPRVAAVYVGLDYIHLPEISSGREMYDAGAGANADDLDGDNSRRRRRRRNLKLRMERRRMTRMMEEHNAIIDALHHHRKYSRFEHERRRIRRQWRWQHQRRHMRRLASNSTLDVDVDIDIDDGDGDGDGTILSKASKATIFQTTPLSQGYGTHYATAWIGTPNPQPQTLIVDTGSHRTAFPCAPCPDCGRYFHSSSRRQGGYFNPSSSETFETLTCGQCWGEWKEEEVDCEYEDEDEEGEEETESGDGDNDGGSNSTIGGGRCTIAQAYEEGSSWNAYQARDFFFCSDNHPEFAPDADENRGTRQEEEEDFKSKRRNGMDASSRTLLRQRELNYNYNYNKNIMDDYRGYGFPYVFGCQSSVTGQFRTQLADGIMGMSAVRDIPSYQMYQHGLIPRNAFSLCFRQEVLNPPTNRANANNTHAVTAGILTFGGVNKRMKRKSPMIYAKDIRKTKDDSEWYTVKVKKLLLKRGGGGGGRGDDDELVQVTEDNIKDITVISDDVKSLNSGWGVIIDSGSTDTYLQSRHEKVFVEAWKEMTGGRDYSNDAMKLTPEELKKLPTVMIQMEAYDEEEGDENDDNDGDEHQDQQDPNDTIGMAGSVLSPSSPRDVLLAIPASHYMEYSPSSDTYSARLFFTESSGGTLGANAMMNYDVLFDWNGKIGFSQSDCDFDTLKDEDGGIVEVELDEVKEDKEQIGKDDRNRSSKREDISKKVETATMTVTDADAHASNETETNTEANQMETKTKTETDADNGANSEIADETIAEAEDVAESKTTMEGGENSGAKSTIENKAMKSCLPDAYGTSDPCRVPFFVYVIIKFAEISPITWTRRDEDFFLVSFAKAANKRREAGDELFGHCDVKVKSVESWEDIDDQFGKDDDDEESIQVTQLELEIAMHNENAILSEEVDKIDSVRSTEGGKGILHIISGPSAPSGIFTCKETDVHRLSKKTGQTHLRLESDTFMLDLIESIRNEGKAASVEGGVFEPFFSNSTEGVDSSHKVLNSWTVKNEVGGLFQNNVMDQNDPLTMIIIIALLCLGIHLIGRFYELMKAKNIFFSGRIHRKKEILDKGVYSQLCSRDDEEAIMPFEHFGNNSNEDNDIPDGGYLRRRGGGTRLGQSKISSHKN